MRAGREVFWCQGSLEPQFRRIKCADLNFNWEFFCLCCICLFERTSSERFVPKKSPYFWRPMIQKDLSVMELDETSPICDQSAWREKWFVADSWGFDLGNVIILCGALSWGRWPRAREDKSIFNYPHDFVQSLWSVLRRPPQSKVEQTFRVLLACSNCTSWMWGITISLGQVLSMRPSGVHQGYLQMDLCDTSSTFIFTVPQKPLWCFRRCRMWSLMDKTQIASVSATLQRSFCYIWWYQDWIVVCNLSLIFILVACFYRINL